MNNNIKKMLRITDNHLNITSTEEANINGKKTLIIKGTYSPMPSACKNCHSAVVDNDGKTNIVRNGKKSHYSSITLSKPTYHFKAKEITFPL